MEKEIKVKYLKSAFVTMESAKRKNPELDKNIRQFTKVLTGLIEKNHPEFFEVFASKITSNDPYKVKESLLESALVVRESLLEMNINLNQLGTENENLETRSKTASLNLSKDLDIYSENGKKEFTQRINKISEELELDNNSDGGVSLIPCIPVVAYCVYHTAAVATTMAAVAATAVALAAVLVKTAAVAWDTQWFWESPNGGDEILNEEILIADIIDAY